MYTDDVNVFSSINNSYRCLLVRQTCDFGMAQYGGDQMNRYRRYLSEERRSSDPLHHCLLLK